MYLDFSLIFQSQPILTNAHFERSRSVSVNSSKTYRTVLCNQTIFLFFGFASIKILPIPKSARYKNRRLVFIHSKKFSVDNTDIFNILY